VAIDNERRLTLVCAQLTPLKGTMIALTAAAGVARSEVSPRVPLVRALELALICETCLPSSVLPGRQPARAVVNRLARSPRAPFLIEPLIAPFGDDHRQVGGPRRTIETTAQPLQASSQRPQED
jgi:hypothetical protein